MEVIEKKDILNLASDPFVRSILIQNGMTSIPPAITSYYRGNLSFMSDHKVQQVWFQAGKKDHYH